MKIHKKSWFYPIILGAVLFTSSCEITSNLREDPGDMTPYRGNNGITYKFTVTGDDVGGVWGGADGYYTDDSDVSTAAVHAGVLTDGETGTVSVTVRAGRDEYFGPTQNGIISYDYGSCSGSYEFED